MTEVLLVVVGLILVGLPLLAHGLDRVVPHPRQRALPVDPYDAVASQFHLTWQEKNEVESAVRQGRAVRPRLRPAARAFAQLLLAEPTYRGRPIGSYPIAGRVVVAGTAVAVYIGYCVTALVLHLEFAVVNVVGYGVLLVFARVARTRRRRAVRRSLLANAVTLGAGAGGPPHLRD